MKPANMNPDEDSGLMKQHVKYYTRMKSELSESSLAECDAHNNEINNTVPQAEMYSADQATNYQYQNTDAGGGGTGYEQEMRNLQEPDPYKMYGYNNQGDSSSYHGSSNL